MASLAAQLQYLTFPCGISCYRSPLRSYKKKTTSVNSFLVVVIDARVLENLLSLLEVTPVCQGIQDDNLLELARPKNPLSHL